MHGLATEYSSRNACTGAVRRCFEAEAQTDWRSSSLGPDSGNESDDGNDAHECDDGNDAHETTASAEWQHEHDEADSVIPEGDCASGTRSAVIHMRKRLNGTEMRALHDLGLKLLQGFPGRGWKSVSHCGFRPWKALGMKQAMRVWHSICFDLPACLRRGRIFSDSSATYFREGLLSTKVLSDRMHEILGRFDIRDFLTFWNPRTVVPRTGCAARTVALYEGLPMIAGDVFIFPEFSMIKLQTKVNASLGKLSEEHVDVGQCENVSCCWAKCLDDSLGGSHREY